MRKLLHEEIPRLNQQEAVRVQRHPISVVVDNVRSIHNVGSFFRSSDAAWIERLYLSGITGTPEHRALHKTALGAQDAMPWQHVPQTSTAIRDLKNKGYRILALELTDTPTLVNQLTLSDFPAALIVGNELSGVSEEALKLADIALEIPQYGTKQSLNVSVAFGIALLDLVRHYRTLKQAPLLEDAFQRPSPEF